MGCRPSSVVKAEVQSKVSVATPASDVAPAAVRPIPSLEPAAHLLAVIVDISKSVPQNRRES